MLKAAQVALDLLREAMWRKWFLGLFLTITGVLVLLGFSLQLDVVDGALIGVLVFATVYAAMMLAAVVVRSAAFSAAVGLATVILGVISSNRASIARAIDPGAGRLVFEWAMVPVPKLGTLALRA